MLEDMFVNSGPLAGAPGFLVKAWGAAGVCLCGFPTQGAEEERSVSNLLVHVAIGMCRCDVLLAQEIIL